jgi:hypothetical protein
MNQSRADELIWRAFNIGARAAFTSKGESFTPRQGKKINGLLRELANGDYTLIDPTELTQPTDSPALAQWTIQMGHLMIRDDKKLATRIRRAAIAATRRRKCSD